jgi:hypothetical protein
MVLTPKVITLVSLWVIGGTAGAQTGQGHVNLEDVKIEGEANSDGSHFDQRSQFDLKDRIKFRSSFLDRVEENGPSYVLEPDKKEPAGP